MGLPNAHEILGAALQHIDDLQDIVDSTCETCQALCRCRAERVR